MRAVNRKWLAAWAVLGCVACSWMLPGYAQQRCSQGSVEFLVGGSAPVDRLCSSGPTMRSTSPVREQTKSTNAAPHAVAQPSINARVAQDERRMILEHELHKEQQWLQRLQDPSNAEHAQSSPETLRRHQANVLALRAEIARLP